MTAVMSSKLASSQSVEDALNLLKQNDIDQVKTLWNRVSVEVEEKATSYLARYGSWSINIGSALFDRHRQLCWAGPNGVKQLSSFGVALEDF